MEKPPVRIDVDRSLTDQEASLIRWMLQNGDRDNENALRQLQHARVVAICACGCASIDLAVADQRADEAAMVVLADFQWRNEAGHPCGAFVFARGGCLAGLDLWSMDGACIPSSLPAVEDLVPLSAQLTS